jgi:ATP-dependent DNA ligase
LTGDLRIGLREGLVEEAIAKAFDVSLEEVKQANMLLGDIGRTAFWPREKSCTMPSYQCFVLLNACSPLPNPARMPSGTAFIEVAEATRSGSSIPGTVYVEDKFDGIRAQLHRSAERVEIFSRDLRRITGQFPELVDQARKFDQDLIADGEIIAFDEGRRLTFFDLQKRLGRKHDTLDLFAGAAAESRLPL